MGVVGGQSNTGGGLASHAYWISCILINEEHVPFNDCMSIYALPRIVMILCIHTQGDFTFVRIYVSLTSHMEGDEMCIYG